MHFTTHMWNNILERSKKLSDTRFRSEQKSANKKRKIDCDFKTCLKFSLWRMIEWESKRFDHWCFRLIDNLSLSGFTTPNKHSFHTSNPYTLRWVGLSQLNRARETNYKPGDKTLKRQIIKIEACKVYYYISPPFLTHL